MWRACRRISAPSDRSRLNAYLEDVREIERRIQRIEKYNASGEARALPAAPLGVPDSYEEHVKLMFDLQALAFMTDTTRVSAFKMSRDVSDRVFPESGVKTPFHPCSHHGENPAQDRGVRQAQSLPRQPASVLPREAEEHAGWRRQPAGSLDGAVRQPHGRFERSQSQARAAVPGWATPTASSRATCTSATKDGTPMANVLLTMLHKLGVNVETFRRQHRRDRDLRSARCMRKTL